MKKQNALLYYHRGCYVLKKILSNQKILQHHTISVKDFPPERLFLQKS
jgi:hypothetical protein